MTAAALPDIPLDVLRDDDYNGHKLKLSRPSGNGTILSEVNSQSTAHLRDRISGSILLLPLPTSSRQSFDLANDLSLLEEGRVASSPSPSSNSMSNVASTRS